MWGWPVVPDSVKKKPVINSKVNLTKKACIISYNSRGFSTMHQDFIKTLTSDKIVGDKLPILCNQENFILRGNFYKLRKACPDSHFVFNAALKSTLDKGRPKGGMFIAVPNSIKSQVSDVSPGHWRVQAVIISSVESNINHQYLFSL